MKHVKHVIFLNWHSLCGRSASFALTVIGLGRLGGFVGSPGEPWADLGAFCGWSWIRTHSAAVRLLLSWKCLLEATLSLMIYISNCTLRRCRLRNINNFDENVNKHHGFLTLSIFCNYNYNNSNNNHHNHHNNNNQLSDWILIEILLKIDDFRLPAPPGAFPAAWATFFLLFSY